MASPVERTIHVACRGADQLKLSQLTEFQGDLKTLSMENHERLKREMLDRGFSAPFFVWKNEDKNYLLDGHQRYRTLKAMEDKDGFKLPPLPVVYVDAKNKKEAKHKLLALASQYGKVEAQGLYEFASEAGLTLDELKDSFAFPEVDFEKFESEFFDTDHGTDGLTDPDAIPTEAGNEFDVHRGDVWQLGNHRLMCGDSTSQNDVESLLDGQSPNTMITDPPYGIKYEAGWRAEAKGVKKTEREEQSNLKNDDRSDWYDAYVLHKGDVAYVWHSSIFTDVVMDGLKRAGFELKAQIIWNKNVHALSRSDYQWKHEPCWYAVRSGKKHSWLGDRKQKSVWDVNNIIYEKDCGGKTSHPTQKPVDLYLISIKNHTAPGDSIYEPFGGSGTSIIAAEKTGRKSFTMELDEKFCSVIIKRWQEFTGNKAERIVDGTTCYSSLASE